MRVTATLLVAGFATLTVAREYAGENENENGHLKTHENEQKDANSWKWHDVRDALAKKTQEWYPFGDRATPEAARPGEYKTVDDYVRSKRAAFDDADLGELHAHKKHHSRAAFDDADLGEFKPTEVKAYKHHARHWDHIKGVNHARDAFNDGDLGEFKPAEVHAYKHNARDAFDDADLGEFKPAEAHTHKHHVRHWDHIKGVWPRHWDHEKGVWRRHWDHEKGVWARYEQPVSGSPADGKAYTHTTESKNTGKHTGTVLKSHTSVHKSERKTESHSKAHTSPSKTSTHTTETKAGTHSKLQTSTRKSDTHTTPKSTRHTTATHEPTHKTTSTKQTETTQDTHPWNYAGGYEPGEYGREYANYRRSEHADEAVKKAASADHYAQHHGNYEGYLKNYARSNEENSDGVPVDEKEAAEYAAREGYYTGNDDDYDGGKSHLFQRSAPHKVGTVEEPTKTKGKGWWPWA